MSYLERIKKLSTYSHLPNFAILSKNKLYLPNSTNQYTILGKWGLDWIESNRCAVGIVEQDNYSNISFQITSCYECTDDETAFQLVPKPIFVDYWNRVYQNDPFLSYINVYVSNFYQSSPMVSPKNVVKDLPDPTAVISKVRNMITSAIQVLEKPEKPETPKAQEVVKPKEKTIDLQEPGNKLQVCKTDKPDVYHVYQSNKYVSTCLIPNMKTSRYMQDLFETKQIGEMVTMNMKLHANTSKYYPII